MRWLVTLTDEDLEIGERACRSLSYRYRQNAERQRNPFIRSGAIETAERFEPMAEPLKRARTVG